MRTNARSIALGGMLTAVAVVMMCLGSMIPVNTYLCPVVCMLITRPVLQFCGRKIGWCYYLAVAVLSAMLAPDREAAMVYVFLGYYPMLQPMFQKIRLKALRICSKLAFFTAAGAAAYGVIFYVMGLEELLEEGETVGAAMLIVTVLLWDAMFLMVDRLLEVGIRRRRK